MIKAPSIIFLLILVLLTHWGGPAAAEDERLPEAIIYTGDRPGHILVVDKAEQMLYLYSHDSNGRVALERVMACSTGKKLGDKLVEGDQKTPNGFYLLNQKLLPRELSPIYGTLAYPTDYPNFWDKSLKRGGYGIWIHGINKPLVNYDSNGCVELENADIARMEEILRLHDTPLITYENLALALASDLRREADEVRAFIEAWRRAWVDKDQQSYQAKYDPSFINSDRRTFSAWMTHKAGVARNYETISVEIKDLRVFRHRDVIVAIFEQDYRGDQRFTSIGQKRLYLKNTPEGLKIVGEEFGPKPQTETSKWLTAEQKRVALDTPPLVVAKNDNAGGQLQPQPASAGSGITEAAATQSPDWGLEPETARVAAEAKAAAEDQVAAVAEAAAIIKAAAEDQPVTPPAAPAPAVSGEPEAAVEYLYASLRTADLDWPAAIASAPPRAEPAPAMAAVPTRAAPAPSTEEFISLIENWGQAWSRQDTSAYFSFYHPDFYYRARNLDHDAFVEYRQALIENAGTIHLRLSDFEVRAEGETVRVAFRQDYRSDQMSDLGRKTLTLKKSGGDWKIIGESWKNLN